jgi:hypothetical protein
VQAASTLLQEEGGRVVTYKRNLTLLSLSAVLAVVAILGLSLPGPKGLAQEQRATNVSALAEGAACACTATGGGECCSSEGGNCCCGKELLAKAEQEKPKDEMKKASKEAMAKGEAARKAITDHQKALAKDGVYSCCIKPGCTFCSTAGDMCPCAMNLAKGDSVCPECWGGWQAGQGRLKDIDRSKVQIIPKEKLEMMYDMKSKNMKKATEGSESK